MKSLASSPPSSHTFRKMLNGLPNRELAELVTELWPPLRATVTRLGSEVPRRGMVKKKRDYFPGNIAMLILSPFLKQLHSQRGGGLMNLSPSVTDRLTESPKVGSTPERERAGNPTNKAIFF